MNEALKRLEELKARKAILDAEIAKMDQEESERDSRTPITPMSFQQSREEGLTTALPAPMGQWRGKLIARAWGRHMNLLCYFEHMETGEIHRCVAYRRPDRSYTASDKDIDFAENDIEGSVYLLDTGLNGKGNPLWRSATLIED
jgi:hypothetical protein